MTTVKQAAEDLIRGVETFFTPASNSIIGFKIERLRAALEKESSLAAALEWISYEAMRDFGEQNVYTAKAREALGGLKVRAPDDLVDEIQRIVFAFASTDNRRAAVLALAEKVRNKLDALADRVSELEDTLRLNDANDHVASSCGRDTHSVQVAEEIYKRRGENWPGAEYGR